MADQTCHHQFIIPGVLWWKTWNSFSIECILFTYPYSAKNHPSITPKVHTSVNFLMGACKMSKFGKRLGAWLRQKYSSSWYSSLTTCMYNSSYPKMNRFVAKKNYMFLGLAYRQLTPTMYDLRFSLPNNSLSTSSNLIIRIYFRVGK